ncbi:flagellar basal-body rod protein FlgF [Fodinicurvata halophila]|uniref:Flagellar basal-body rod protein FlgF n=1 Tax=Fodinicurvata halophila TaxID=1419723 RepID=A0ABV8UJC3_9PROT
MESPSYIALSRLTGLRREMDVVTNNLANMNTPGYQRESMMFSEYLADTRDMGAGAFRKISMVQDLASVRDLSEGPMINTDNPLDVAISGPGYFTVETEDGARYTRKGNFSLDNNGQIVTSEGDPVMGMDGAPIVLPPEASDVVINKDGTIAVRDPANPLGGLPIGQIGVVQFEEEYELKREAGGLLNAEDQEPMAAEAEDVSILQGMLEDSNVQGVVEMTRMIETMRSYQSTKNMMDQEHERQKQAIQILGSSGR